MPHYAPGTDAGGNDDVQAIAFGVQLISLLDTDRSALQWRRDQAIDGAAGLELQHLYRAMGWLGEALGEREPDAPSENCR